MNAIDGGGGLILRTHVFGFRVLLEKAFEDGRFLGVAGGFQLLIEPNPLVVDRRVLGTSGFMCVVNFVGLARELLP